MKFKITNKNKKLALVFLVAVISIFGVYLWRRRNKIKNDIRLNNWIYNSKNYENLSSRALIDIEVSNKNKNISEYPMTKLLKEKLDLIRTDKDPVMRNTRLKEIQKLNCKEQLTKIKHFAIGCFYNSIIKFDKIAKCINNNKILGDHNLLFLNELVSHLFLLKERPISLKEYDDFVYETLLKDKLEEYVADKEKNKFIIANSVYDEFTASFEKNFIFKESKEYSAFKETFRDQIYTLK